MQPIETSPWKHASLGDLSSIRYGMGQPPEQADDGVPMIRATNVKRGRISGRGLIRIKRSAISKSRDHYLEAGDVLVVRSGAYTGDVALVTKEWAGSVAGYDLVLSPKESLVPAFCVFSLLSDSVQRHFKGQSNRAAQPHLNRQQLESTTIPLPPLPEQKKIAHILSTVQRAMEQQERLLATTAELKKTLLHQLFTQGIRHEPQKQIDIGPVPESWELVKLSDVCLFQTGGTPSKQRPDYWEGNIPWVSPKDMKRPRLADVKDHISQEALEEGSKLAPAGSIFVVVRGMILAKDVPVALAEVPMAINQDMRAIIPGSRLQPAFLLYAMVALKRKLFEKVGRSAHGTMTLMSSEIADFQIPMPDKETQQEIASAIETVEQKHALVRRKHAALTALFRTLLHQLMTAQIRLNRLGNSILDKSKTEI